MSDGPVLRHVPERKFTLSTSIDRARRGGDLTGAPEREIVTETVRADDPRHGEVVVHLGEPVEPYAFLTPLEARALAGHLLECADFAGAGI